VTVVQTLGGLTDLQPGWYPGTGAAGSMTLYDRYTYDYEFIYRTQPAVRKVVDFLARNIAQLGLHIFRRVSDTDRVRVTDSDLARTIKRPNPQTTRYQFIDGFVRDVCVHGNAFAPKIRLQDGRVGLVLVPPWLMWVKGGLIPGQYTLTYGGKRLDMLPAELLHSRLGGRIQGISPLETLRRVLAEEAASGAYRERYWQTGARMGTIIERPADAPEWGPEARARFRAEFESLYTGELASGRTAILEDGMKASVHSFNAVDSQYLEGRKFNLQEVCTAYHIPPPMVGILDQATFSNIETQHRMLYQDTLGPWLVMITEDWELQLLPEFADTADVYLEFNIEEKLRGSFQEQATSLQTLVGRPILTANEGRALLNRPRIDGGDALVTPLNVLVGGQASARDCELGDDLLRLNYATASVFAERIIDELGPIPTDDGDDQAVDFDPAEMVPYLTENARIAAEGINGTTRDRIVEALRGDTPLADILALFEIAGDQPGRPDRDDQGHDGGRVRQPSGRRGGRARTKTWRVNSRQPALPAPSRERGDRGDRPGVRERHEVAGRPRTAAPTGRRVQVLAPVQQGGPVVKFKTAPLRGFKALDDGKGEFEAIVAVFGNVDLAGTASSRARSPTR
jgi:HK97 family phage portal protein